MHILVVEDDTRIAGLVRRGLEEEQYEVTLAYDGQMGRKLASDKKFDAIIIDIILPKINGLDLCRLIREKLPSIPILMLTALGTTDDKVEGFDSGADDYLVKPFDFRELLVRLNSLITRTSGYSQPKQKSLQFEDLYMDLDTKAVRRGEVEIRLTPREFNLLEYMLKNPCRVLSRTEIAQNVWDTHFDTGTNFIDVYINYLRKKVDKPFAKTLIHTRHGMGFILSGDEI